MTSSSSGFQVSGSAPDYYERFNPPIMAPFIEAVIAAAEIASGASVLDVACGTGLATRAAALAAASSGRVAGLDLNPEMLQKARSIAPLPGTAPIEWFEGSALDLPFAAGEFQAVLCQQGIQFFPDLDRAAAEMARVAAPGARVVASFWASLEEQTYMRAQIEGVRAALGDAAQAISAGFSLPPARARAAFESAGLREVQTTLVTAIVTIDNLEEFALGQVAALPVGPAMRALSPEQRMAYVRHHLEVLAPYQADAGVYRCPFASWLVVGVR